jgi:pimeloyl-ACP methyl ester carboxylesterase
MPTQKVNGVELFYDEVGSGKPILFHHGYTGAHDVWFEEIAARLKDRYRCIVMDCRGAGDSGHPTDGYNIRQYAQDVVAMADVLGLDTFTFVGHSMGGGIGYQLGTYHGDRLDKLVLVAPIPASGLNTEPGVHEAAKALREGPDGRERMIAQRMLQRLRAPEESIVRGVDRALSVSQEHYDDSWQSMVDFDVSSKLHVLTTPTLIIAGAADGLCAANVNDWQKLPNATLHVFSRVGHNIPRDVPDEFAETLDDFMQHGVINAKTLQDRLSEGVSE